MFDDEEDEKDWEDDFQRAKDFMSGYKLKASLVPADKKPFYEALTTLIESAMDGDKIIADRKNQLPEDQRSKGDEGFFMDYINYGGTNDEGFFVTSRSGWTNRDIGPQIEAHRRPEGRFIRLSRTNEARSRLNQSLLTTGRLASIDVFDDGRIESVFIGEPNREIVAGELQTLTNVLQGSNMDVQQRLQALRLQDSGGSAPPF